jgi:hypothetical protein
VAIRTQLSGAYRYRRDGADLPITETFTFRVLDHMIGGEGWRLTAMRTDEHGTLAVDATGEWAHHLHPGNWQRIVTTAATVRWFPPDAEQPATQATYELLPTSSTPRLRCSIDGVSSTHQAEPDLVLHVPVLCLAGATTERMAGRTQVSMVQPKLGSDATTILHPQFFTPGVSDGEPTTLDLPDMGTVRGRRYQWATTGTDHVVSGDGLLAYERTAEHEAWLVRAGDERR